MSKRIQQPAAVAVLTPFAGSKLKGIVGFYPLTKGMAIKIQASKVPPGLHGFHIHTYGDLRGAKGKTCCQAAGGHYNPTGKSHGGTTRQSGKNRHKGDLGNVRANSKGEIYQVIREPSLTLKDVIGRSIVLHADRDDLGKGPFEDSVTTGHSGARIGCGVIGYANPDP